MSSPKFIYSPFIWLLIVLDPDKYKISLELKRKGGGSGGVCVCVSHTLNNWEETCFRTVLYSFGH